MIFNTISLFVFLLSLVQPQKFSVSCDGDQPPSAGNVGAQTTISGYGSEDCTGTVHANGGEKTTFTGYNTCANPPNKPAASTQWVFGRSVCVTYANDEPTATDVDVFNYHHECSQYNVAVRNGRADMSTCKPQAPVQISAPLRTDTCLKKPAGIHSISLGSYTDPVPAMRSIARSYKGISRRAPGDADEDDSCDTTGL